jgi:hypothetical protein
MSLLSAQYEKETGKPCCGLMCHVIAPTSEYANWLEDEVKKLTAHNSQSDAIALWIEVLTAIKDGSSFETWLRANHQRVIAACAQQHT